MPIPIKWPMPNFIALSARLSSCQLISRSRARTICVRGRRRLCRVAASESPSIICQSRAPRKQFHRRRQCHAPTPICIELIIHAPSRRTLIECGGEARCAKCRATATSRSPISQAIHFERGYRTIRCGLLMPLRLSRARRYALASRCGILHAFDDAAPRRAEDNAYAMPEAMPHTE